MKLQPTLTARHGRRKLLRRSDPDRKRIDSLCAWFDRHARKLPWRTTKRSGYSALIAETMLQQTQVSRVVDRYRAFIGRFPTMRSLAAAKVQDVLALWQGMGYYRRAIHLHRAAQVVVREFGGRMPREVDHLMRLPGVGRYTAGAIASIAYGRHAPIVDGNVHRVLARWYAHADASSSSASRWSWEKATELVQLAKRPGVFNEALMELGATICTPRSPRCARCPVAPMCQARIKRKQDAIPLPKFRAKTQSIHHHAVIITRNGRMLLEQRSSRGMWASMWQTPTIESDRRFDLIEVKQMLPIRVRELQWRGSFDHHTTHRRIRFHVFSARAQSEGGNWVNLDDLQALPMSSAHRRVLTFSDSPMEENRS